jgi:hypothetical protein
MRRHPTKSDTEEPRELSAQQEVVIDLLAVGKTLTDAAAAVEVSRQTVSGWLNHDCAFQANLHARRQELWAHMVDKLRALVPRALEVVEKALDGENPLPAAIHVIRAAGLYGVPPPSGSVEAEDLDIARRKKERHRLLSSLGM